MKNDTIQTRKWITKCFMALLTFCLVLTGIFFIAPIEAEAAVGGTFTVDNITYMVLSESGEAGTVTVSGSTVSEQGTVTIPNSVTNGSVTYTVTVIGASAFYGNTYVTAIELPNTLTTIGANAFNGCTGITKVEIPASITSIGVNAFANCTNLQEIRIYAKNITFASGSIIPNQGAYYCYSGSIAETFAQSNGATSITYVYDATCDLNGGTGTGVVTAVPVAACETFSVSSLSNTASKTGYNLTKYVDQYGDEYLLMMVRNNITMKEGGLHFTAQWSPRVYNVELDPNGGEGDFVALTMTYDAEVPELDNHYPFRAGYTFAGYFGNQDGTGTMYYSQDLEPSATYNVAGSSVLYAKWIPNTYSVTYDLDGGTHEDCVDFTATYGETYTLLPNTIPTKSGYTFVQWEYTYAMDGYTVTMDDEMIGQEAQFEFDEDLTFVAVWKERSPVRFEIASIEKEQEYFLNDPFDVFRGTLYYDNGEYKSLIVYESDVTGFSTATIQKEPVTATVTKQGCTDTFTYTVGYDYANCVHTWVQNYAHEVQCQHCETRVLLLGNSKEYDGEPMAAELLVLNGEFDTSALTIVYGTEDGQPPSGLGVHNALVMIGDGYIQNTLSIYSYYTAEFYFEDLNGEYVIDESMTARKQSVGYTDQMFNTPFGFVQQAYTPIQIEPDGSTVLKLYYDRAVANITLYPNGGAFENGETVQIQVKYGTPFWDAVQGVEIPERDRLSYKFLGWTLDGILITEDDERTMSLNAVELFASWQERVVTGIEIPEDKLVQWYSKLSTEKFREFEAIIRYADNSTEPITVTENMLTGFDLSVLTPLDDYCTATVIYKTFSADFTYYVRNISQIEYYVKLDEGYYESDVLDYYEGQTITLMSGDAFERVGYTFYGWSDNTNGGTYAAGEEYTLQSGDTVLDAVWKLNAPTITIEGVEPLEGDDKANYVLAFTYDGNAHNITLTGSHELGNAVTYEYYMIKYTANSANPDMDSLPPWALITDTTQSFTNVSDSNYYLCVVKTTLDDETTAAYTIIKVDISKADQTITLSEDEFTYSEGLTIDFADYVRGAGDGTLSYAVSAQSGVTFDFANGVVSNITKAGGTFTLTVTKAATDNYNSATQTFTVTLNKGTQTLSVSGSPNPPTWKQEYQVSVSGNKGALSYAIISGNATVNESGVIIATGTGQIRYSVTAAATNLYETVTVERTVTFGKVAGNLAPDYVAPSEQTICAESGDLYEVIAIPDGWYMNTIKMVQSGVLAITATFTPSDTDNYDTYIEEFTVYVEEHAEGDEATCTTPQICTRCNVVLTEALDHDFNTSYVSMGESGHAHKCSRCDEYDETVPHSSEGEANCTTSKTCDFCGYVMQASGGHSFTEEIADEAHLKAAATCVSGAEYWYDCAYCDVISDTLSFIGGEPSNEHTYTDCCDTVCNLGDCGYERELTPHVHIGSSVLTNGQYLDETGNVSATKPTGGYAYLSVDTEGALTLTLHDFTYEGNTYASYAKDIYAVIFSVFDLTVKVEGENLLSVNEFEVDSYWSSIAVYGDLTVKGDGKEASSLEIGASAELMYRFDVLSAYSDLTIENVSVKAIDAEYGISSGRNILITNSKLYLATLQDCIASYGGTGDIKILNSVLECYSANGSGIYIYCTETAKALLIEGSEVYIHAWIGIDSSEELSSCTVTNSDLTVYCYNVAILCSALEATYSNISITGMNGNAEHDAMISASLVELEDCTLYIDTNNYFGLKADVASFVSCDIFVYGLYGGLGAGGLTLEGCTLVSEVGGYSTLASNDLRIVGGSLTSDLILADAYESFTVEGEAQLNGIVYVYDPDTQTTSVTVYGEVCVGKTQYLDVGYGGINWQAIAGLRVDGWLHLPEGVTGQQIAELGLTGDGKIECGSGDQAACYDTSGNNLYYQYEYEGNLDFSNVGDGEGQTSAVGDGYSFNADTLTLTLTNFAIKGDLYLPHGNVTVVLNGYVQVFGSIYLAEGEGNALISLEGDGWLWVDENVEITDESVLTSEIELSLEIGEEVSLAVDDYVMATSLSVYGMLEAQYVDIHALHGGGLCIGEGGDMVATVELTIVLSIDEEPNVADVDPWDYVVIDGGHLSGGIIPVYGDLNGAYGIFFVPEGLETNYYWHRQRAFVQSLPIESHVYDNDCDTTCNVCGAERTIAHDFTGEWQEDASGHWHVCETEGCTVTDTKAGHTSSGSATEDTPETCTVCGHIITPATGHINHTSSGEYGYDENSHWFKCVGCASEKLSPAGHSFDNACDVDCICGYQRTITHDYTELKFNDTHHWYVCSVCGAEQSGSRVAHNGGDATCEALAVCSCGQSYGGYGSHKFGQWQKEIPATCVATGTKGHKTCWTCEKHFADDGVTEINDLTIAIDANNHDVATEWTGVENGHYHKCKRTGCEYHTALEDHQPDRAEATEDEPVKCSVCEYIITTATGHTTHTSSGIYGYDANGHWFKCVGCESEKVSPAGHSFDNDCDTDCACGYVRTITHDFTGEWEKDASGHWHVCAKNGCSVTDEKQNHESAGAATETDPEVCSICGWEIAPALGHTTHTPEAEWQKNDTHHWHECTGCDGQELNKAAHEYDNNCDTDCNVCGAPRTVAHDFTGAWQKDASGHWHVCAKNGCSVIDEKQNHESAGAATETDPEVCSICGWEIAPALGHTTHTPETEWQKNDTHHWHECTGCDGQELEKAAHNDGDNNGSCDACGYTMSVTPPPHTHSHGSTWVTDANEHWNECECGDKANKAAHADDNGDNKCDTCDYAMPAHDPDEPGTDTPDDPTDPDEGEDKDHSKCLAEASGWKRFWNAIGNFFRRIFSKTVKCVCGDKLPEDEYTRFKEIFKQNK